MKLTNLSVREISWKVWTSIGLGLLLAADLGLAVFLWQGERQDPLALRADRDRLTLQSRLLKADVDRAERIRKSLPAAAKECDDFYHDSFLDSATGYSQIESDLGSIASAAGVKTTDFRFQTKEAKDRGATEISIEASVDGDYAGIVRFINGLERSKNFYLLDSLRLASVATGGIKLSLDLHTYFRT